MQCSVCTLQLRPIGPEEERCKCTRPIVPNALSNPIDAFLSHSINVAGSTFSRRKVDFAALWDEFHTMEEPTQEKLMAFAAKLPSFGCGCREHFLALIVRHPPRFDDWRRWSWEIHNLVNAMPHLSKPQFAWSEFENKYPVWKQVEGLRIGFVAGCFEQFGGTETFHRTLIPRLPGVIGFASHAAIRGDTSMLGVPATSGPDGIKSLASKSDVIVSWSVDWSGVSVRPRRLVTVHHGSPLDVWETDRALQGDHIVAVSPETASHLRSLTSKPVTCIPNAVDPGRLKPINTVINAVETNGKKICLWPHRFSPDKRAGLAVEIARHLPSDWHMVLIGHRGEPIGTEPNNRATILPPQHPGDWLSVASCVLSTSQTEGFGLSIAEAITAGVPVVSSPAGIAKQPGLAIVVPTDAEPAEWAAAIAGSHRHALPSRDLFSLDTHIAAWLKVTCGGNHPTNAST